jgi:MFS family permease
MFGAGEISFALFAAEIRMPTLFFGLLTGVPLLLGPLIQALAANCLDRYGHRKGLVLGGALTQMACFVPLAILAFVIARSDGSDRSALWVSVLFMLIVCVYFAAGSFTHPPYSSMIGDLVPEQRRGDYFARVSRDASLLVLVAQAVVGGALWFAERDAAHGSLALLIFSGAFLLAGMARLHSYAQIVAIKDPPYEPNPDAYFTFVQFIRRTRESNFVKFVAFVALTHFSAQVAGPYFLPYWKYELKYDTSHWVVMSGAATLASILMLPLWGRFSNRFGNKCTLFLTGLAISIIPLGWMFTTDFYVLVSVNLFSGVVWSGFNLSSWNYILEAVTPHKRARCVAYFNIVCGLGMFCGSMVGAWLQKGMQPDGWLSAFIPQHEMKPGLVSVFFYLLLASSLCRFLTCLLLLPLFRELRKVQPFPTKHWIFQVARIRIPVGVRFDAEPLDEEDETDGGMTPEKPETEAIKGTADAGSRPEPETEADRRT